jgi:hypothetical protein
VSRYAWAIGGDDGDYTHPMDSIERAPVSPWGEVGEWEMLDDPLLQPRSLAAGVTIGRFVYVAGGWYGFARGEVLRAMILDPLLVPRFEDLELAKVGDGLEPGTWLYRVATLYDAADEYNPGGESLAGDPILVTLPDRGHDYQVEISWTPQPRAVGYRIYRSPSPDLGSGSEEWIADVGSTTSWTDTGLSTNGGKVPLVEGALGKWAVVGAMNHARHSACVAVGPDPVPDPQVLYLYVAGGQTDAGEDQDVVEYLTIEVKSEHEQHVPYPFLATSANRLHLARRECAGFTVDATLHSTVRPDEAWVYFAGGQNGSTAYGTTDAGLVGEGGEFADWGPVEDMSPARAGFGAASASDFIYVMGGHHGLPAETGHSSELKENRLPELINWNSLGHHMTTKRYLPGWAQESALFLMLGGTTDEVDASRSIDVTTF